MAQHNETSSNDNADLLQALKSIQLELQKMNHTLAAMAGAKSGRAESSPRSEERDGPPARRPRKTGTFNRSDMSASPSFGQGFPKKRSSTSGSSPRPKGKPPAKKGDGYPKKPR